MTSPGDERARVSIGVVAEGSDDIPHLVGSLRTDDATAVDGAGDSSGGYFGSFGDFGYVHREKRAC